MPTLNKYLINFDVQGLEENPQLFLQFLEEYKPEFGRLLKFQQTKGNPYQFEISVPSDTNLFMLGILWSKWRMINEYDNSDDEFED